MYRTDPLYPKSGAVHKQIHQYVSDKLAQRDLADERRKCDPTAVPKPEDVGPKDGGDAPSAAGPSDSGGTGLTVGATEVTKSSAKGVRTLAPRQPKGPDVVPRHWSHTEVPYEEMVALTNRYPVTGPKHLDKACKATSTESVYVKRAKEERHKLETGASDARYTFKDLAVRAGEAHEDAVWRIQETYWRRVTWMLRNAHGELFYRLHDGYLRDHVESVKVGESGQLSFKNWCHYGCVMLAGCAADEKNRIMWLYLSFPEQQKRWHAHWKALATGVRKDELAVSLKDLPDFGARSRLRPNWSSAVIQDSIGQLNQVPFPSTGPGWHQKEAWKKGLGMTYNGPKKGKGKEEFLTSFCVIEELQDALKIVAPWLKFINVALPGETGHSLLEAVHRMTNGDGRGIDELRQQKELASTVYDGNAPPGYSKHKGADRWFKHLPSWDDRVAKARHNARFPAI